MEKRKHYEGLNDQQVVESRAKYGVNLLTPPKKDPLWKQFLEKFSDPLIVILIIAGILSIGIACYEYFGLGEGLTVFFEPAGIFVAILLATGLAFYFELKANKAFNLLNKVNNDEPVKVIRNSNVTVVPKKDIVIDGDEQRLEQVWTNIVSNAIKYTNDGGLITISMKKTSKEVEVSIEDTGIGMSKEVVSHIFERFYREDKARNVEGNGLGLAIVKSIVDLHNGKIDILSQVDVGTVFIVKLPIEKQKFMNRLKL